ncbi:unnamed protein product [Notodromas monacha]|uniref:Uncharacterized protein n=1 Tax=Notodromas monacha TaxID=399045 RepID=A0A7R9BEE7_9CRUS|nr:unnamed protein product [Notodromas monacha]CAG0912931.1 unnamed protein product [Notodromas monacha]
MKPRRRKVVGSESLGKVEEVPVTLATVEAEKARSLFAELKREEDAVSLRNQGSGFFWWILVGCVVSAVLNAVYVATLFENSLHFSHLSTMEREMSLKTEMGFYYKFYKKLTREKDAFWSVLESFRNDTGTEFPNVINAFQRFNLFPEVALGCLYWQVSDFATAWNVSTKNCYIVDISHDHDDNEEAGEETSLVTCSGIGEPMHFYVSVVWCLAGLTAAGIFALGSILSSSLCGGVFAVWSFFCNHTHVKYKGWMDTNSEGELRVPNFFGVPPFVDAFNESEASKNAFTATPIGQFIHNGNLVSAGVAVFPVRNGSLHLDTLPASQFWYFEAKRHLSIPDLPSVGLTYLTMHGNVMILSGVLTASLLAMVSLGATLGPTLRKYLPPMSAAVAQMGFALINTVGFKIELGNYLGTSGRGDDSHVFNLLRAKIANYKDFDTLLYLGQPEFKQLPGATWNDLCSSLLIPVALGVAMHLVVFRWGKVKYAQLRARFENAQNDLKKQENDPEASKIPQDLFGDMEIVEPIKAFHICLALMFGVMAGAIMRLKLFFTPQLCLVASLITGTRFLPERIRSKRKGLLVALLFAMTFKGWDGIQQALKMTGEGWHTRGEKDMLQWIMKDTPKNASFAGDMVTMAGISLVAERLTANHPHFEDFALRRRTEAIYQAFSRRSEKLLHAALRNISADFLVLDAVQCLESRSVKGTLLSLWDQLEPELVGKRQPLCPALYDGKIGPGFSRVFLNDEYSILKVNNL